MRYTQTSSMHCGICNKIIKHKHRFFIIDELIFDLKKHYHYLFKHKIRYYNLKRILNMWLILTLLTPANVLLLGIKLITYPFWILHEIVD